MPPPPRFSVGDSVSRTLQLSLRFFPAFFLIMLVLHAPALIATYAFFDELAQVEIQSEDFLMMAGVEPVDPIYETLSWGVDVWGLVAGAIAAGVFAHIVLQHLQGRRLRWGGTIHLAVARFFPMLFTTILIGLLFLGILFPFGMLVTVVHWSILLLALPVVVILAVAICVAPAVVVAEKAGPTTAIRRSFALTRRHRLPVLGCWITVVFLTTMLAIPFGVVLALTVGPEGREGTLANGLVEQALSVPIWVCPVVIYHGLLRAKEGASAQQLVSVFE